VLILSNSDVLLVIAQSLSSDLIYISMNSWVEQKRFW